MYVNTERRHPFSHRHTNCHFHISFSTQQLTLKTSNVEHKLLIYQKYSAKFKQKQTTKILVTLNNVVDAKRCMDIVIANHRDKCFVMNRI